MWSPSRLAVVVGAALLLGACQVRPLYAPDAAGNYVTSDALRAVAIAPVRERVAQELRNDLLYALHGGSALPERYTLSFVLTEQIADLGIEEFADEPAARLVSLTATFTLTEIATGRTIVSGNSSGSASFDQSNQRFANLRAERDAEERAAQLIAEDIRTRIAASIASGG
jgi:LPS-assembly lipoprotein